MALGKIEVDVFSRPKVGILSSGDELAPPQTAIQPGQVRDVNSYSLSALAEQIGGIPTRYSIVSDRMESLRCSAEKALYEKNQLVVPDKYYHDSLLAPLFEILADPSFRRQVSALPGYDISLMGKNAAEVN
jgi:hypothetical protein